jgi:hypothetical protein
MPTIKLTVAPATSPQRVFNAAQLAAALARKKLSVNWDDDADKVFDALWADAATKAANSVKIDGEQTGNIKARLEAAKLRKKSVSGKLGPGKFLVEIRVLEVAIAANEPPEGEDDEEEPSEGPDKVTIASIIGEPPEQPEEADFAALVKSGDITFANSKVKGLVTGDGNNSDKAASIFERGKGYKGHGKTDTIGGFHAHVTNRTALGFKWNGDKLHIVGVGAKNDSAGKGTSGYDWTT